MSVGIPWEDQKLGKELGEFLCDVRTFIFQKLVQSGEFSIKDLDHNSGSYASVGSGGISNKQITIAAKMLDATCSNKPFLERWKVVVKAAISYR